MRTRGFTLLELLIVAAIIAIIAAIAIPQLLVARRSAWENRAKLTLRSLGSSQLAYQNQNQMKCYGSCTAMCQTGFVQQGYTRGNVIENYSIAVWQCSGSTMIGSESASDASFTIVALPRNQTHKIRTFAICDDQTLRVATTQMLDVPAVPEGSSAPLTPNYDPCSWEPLR